MDMVTRIEIEDSVKVYAKVAARVQYVSHKVGEIHEEFKLEGEEQPIWRMDSFTIHPYKPREGMEHLRELEVSTKWSTTITPYDDNNYSITRIIQFPSWYLTKDGWEEREQQKRRNHLRFLARHNLPHMKHAMSEADSHRESLETKYHEMTILAAQEDEVIDPHE